VRVNGARVAVVRLDDHLYAYRDRCPGCGASLDGGRLRGDLLECPGCACAYDARHAGRRAGKGAGLEPVPLLSDEGGVRVAVGAGP
jgi:nitrite reductase/ring-hydroxylating ferredoxin subunit